MRQANPKPLIEAKLHGAKLRAGETKRKIEQDLRLNYADQSLCIVGPAGAGKSTLMRQIFSQLESEKHVCSWLTFDARDNSPATFVAYLFAALERLSDADKVVYLPALDLSDPNTVEAAFQSLHKIIERLPQDRVLFLDDVHHLTDPALLDGLNYLLDTCAGALRVIIGSRTVPELQIQRREFEQQFHKVSQSDLSFTQHEAIEFFDGLPDVKLEADEIRAIHRATDGWAAGLQFAAIFLRKSPHQKANLLSKMSGRDSDLADYLASNAFSIQSAELQAFLLDTAPLHSFGPDMCQHVCDSANAAELLDQLRASNLFLIRLDVAGDWFRYHHLFGDFLVAKLNKLHPGKLKTIKRKAAQWCIENGMPEDAMRYYLDCEDYDKAAELLAEIGLSISRDEGALSTILRWNNALPETFRSHHPQMVIDHALAMVFTRGPIKARELLEAVRKGLSEIPARWNVTPEQKSELMCYAEAVSLVSYSAEENIDLCLANADKWLMKWPDAIHVNKAIAQAAKSHSFMVSNNFEQARKANAIAQAQALKSDSAHVSIWADCIETMTLTAEGSFNAADISAARAVKRAEAELGGNSQLNSMTHLLKAFSDYERGDRVSAYASLISGQEFSDTYGPVEPLLITFRLLAQKLREEDRFEDALELLERGIRDGLTHSLTRLAATLLADQVTFLIEMGQIEKANALSEKWRETRDAKQSHFGTNSPIQNTMSKRIEIELALANRNPSRALKLCQPLSHELRRYGRFRTIIRVGILRAVALSMDGQTKKSWREMSAVLAKAQERHFVASFFELRHLCVPLIEEIIAYRRSELNDSGGLADTPEDWILRSLEGAASPVDNLVTGLPALIDPQFEALTERETAMLRLAVKGYSNAEIAGTLIISVSTVKWHLHNAFQKLDVKNRSAAVAKATELGFL